MSATNIEILTPTEVAPAVEGAVRPMVEQEGYDLILVEFVGASRVLRLYIDRDEDGVGIDDCTQVSRWVSDLLDAEGITDRISGTYNLEVSSPGLDRPLVRPRDFGRFVGREVKLVTDGGDVDGFPGRKRFRGRLLAADPAQDGSIQMDVDGTQVSIGYPTIEQARLIPEF